MAEIRLECLTWTDVADILKKPNAIVIPVGSVEQHGPHLPLNTDSSIAGYMAYGAARKVTDVFGIRVLVAPTIPYGDVTIHKKFPGTVGISTETLTRVIEELIRAFVEQGFKNFIVLSGHTQNTSAIDTALMKLQGDFPKLGFYGINSMRLAPDRVEPTIKSRQQAKGHACETETAQMLVIQPELVHMERARIGEGRFSISSKFVGEDGYNRNIIFFQSRKHGWEEWGVMGDPTMSTKEAGEKQLEAAIKDLAEIIVQIVKSEE